MTLIEFEEELYRKVKVLNETIWEHRANRPSIEKWLNNFCSPKEKTHALFLLSQFMYFGSFQMRELLKSLYRDLYKYPVVKKIRELNGDTMDAKFIINEFNLAQKQTRFLGIGNPSESGTHLLYFFRQENKLPKDLFINTHEIFVEDSTGKKSLKNENIKHYVFIDDFCGSGSQATNYSEDLIDDIKKLDSAIETSYLMLFATKSGSEEVAKNTSFDSVFSVVELDESFKYFHTNSRYFKNLSTHIDQSFLQSMCEKYGLELIKNLCQADYSEPDLSDIADANKLGFNDSQLLIGFHHNTPDNTLPVIWYDEDPNKWFPVFKRYNKIYGL